MRRHHLALLTQGFAGHALVALVVVTALSVGLVSAAEPAAKAEPATPAAAAATAAPAAPADPYAGNSCVQCHRDLPGRSAQIVELEWKHSVHYGAHVGCDGCHGGNAALKRDQFSSTEAFKRASHMDRDPEFLVLGRGESEFVATTRGRTVSYFCGKCHAEIKEKHLGSPHGNFGDPTCLYCHGQGSHKITPPTLDIIDTRSRTEGGHCSPCHAAATMTTLGRIKTMLQKTQEEIKTSGERCEQLEGWGYRNLKLEDINHHAKEVNSRLRRIFHSFNMREITNFTAEIQDVSDNTDATYELVTNLHATQRSQTLVGLGAVTLLLSFAGMLVYYKHTFLEPHGHGKK